MRSRPLARPVLLLKTHTREHTISLSRQFGGVGQKVEKREEAFDEYETKTKQLVVYLSNFEFIFGLHKITPSLF